MKRIAFSFSAFLCLVISPLFGQYQASWLLDNYAGINSTTLNPALVSNSPFRWDLNLASVEFFFSNNYTYIKNASLQSVYRERDDLRIRNSDNLGDALQEIDFILDFYTGKKNRYGSLQTNILGPSFSFKINANHRVGFFTGARTAFGTRKVPGNISYYEYSSQPLDQTFSVAPFSGAIMAWSEAGLNYNYQKHTADGGKFAFGINVKYLQGWEAFYLELEKGVDISKINPDTIQTTQVPLSFGFTKSLTESAPDVNFDVNGTGFGVDLGFVYTAPSGDSDKKYRYKIGASLMNLGAITFDRNAESHVIDTENIVQLSWDDYNEYSGWDNLDEVVQEFSDRVLNDPDASFSSEKFSVNLPSTLNLQGDFSITPQIYVGANLIQPLNIGKISPATVSHLSISPRFEHRWLGAYLPVSITNWQEVNIGFATRLGYIIIGSEDLGSIFANSNLNSTEVFVALKFNPFSLGVNKKTGKRNRSVKGIKCYKF